MENNKSLENNKESASVSSTSVHPEKGRKKKGRGCLIAVVVVFGLLFLMFLFTLFSSLGYFGPIAGVIGEKKVGVIHINGEIGSTASGGTSAEYILRLLRKAENASDIGAVVLRINSPGGTAASSQEIAMEINRFDKPIVASISDSGASGAYWVASACDKIICAPSSAVGSIGVIMIVPTFKELFEKLGIEYVVISKGKFKDIGNPSRKLTREERKILEEHAQLVYRQFIEGISENRKMDIDKVESIATGEVYVGEKAKELGLVDENGTFFDAVNEAANMAGIEGRPQIKDLDVGYSQLTNILRRFLESTGFYQKLFFNNNVVVK